MAVEPEEMKSAEVKLRKYERWKSKKPYSDRITSLYWRYARKVHGILADDGPW